jgi:hypothetical protein
VNGAARNVTSRRASTSTPPEPKATTGPKIGSAVAPTIDETAASKLLDGYRGLPKVDRERLATFLVRVGEFAASTPRLRELDLNPVVANADGVLPVDVRVVLADEPVRKTSE